MEAAAAPPGRRPIEVGRVISEVFSIYAAQAAPLLFTAFVVYIVVGFVQGLLADTGFVGSLLGSALSLAAGSLYTGFVVKLVQDVRDGKRDFTTTELLSSASPAILPLIVNGFLRGVAIVIGLVLLIVPGLYLLTIWAVCSPAIVVERVGIMDAFGRSRDLVRGQGWAVFGTILVVFLISFAATALAIGIAASIGVGALIAVSIFVTTLVAPISALVASVLFFDLGGGSAAGPAPTDTQTVVEY
jgi:hypothetical protein